MVRPWFELRRDAEIRAEEYRAKFGDQFLARPLASVFGVADRSRLSLLGSDVQ